MLFRSAGLRAELRAYHDSLRAELRADYDSLCAELKADMGALRAELRADHDSLRAELKADNRTLGQRITDVDRRLSAQLLDLTVALERNHRSMLRWFVSTQIATITVVAILIAVVGFVWSIIIWRSQEYVLTTFRVMHTRGVLNKQSSDSSLEGINEPLAAIIWYRTAHENELAAEQARTIPFPGYTYPSLALRVKRHRGRPRYPRRFARAMGPPRAR